MHRHLRLVVCAALLLPAQTAVAQQAPPDRVRAWREDLDSAVTVFLHKRDKTFSPTERAAFETAVATLRDSAATLRDDQIIVRLAKAVALTDNAHTRLYLLRNRTALRRYPLRVWWFSDGLYVVRTDSAHTALLGARVVHIAGKTPAALAKLVAPLYAGNDAWHRYLSTYTMTSPEILHGLDIIPNDTLELEVMPRGATKTMRARVAPLPLATTNEPTEAWWDITPQHSGRGANWVSTLPADTARMPLYLRNPQRNYWFTYLPASRTLYLSYQRSQEQPDDSMRVFTERFFQKVRARNPQKLVLDVRFNTGGDLTKSEGFLKKLSELPMAKQKGHLFVIVGNQTFSAGIYAAALVKELTGALIVGESVGDRLDFWSEGGNYLMPNSKLSLHYADRFHSYSPAEYPERKPYDRDLSVTTLEPDLPAPLASVEYFGWRDPALERIAKYTPKRR
ncbi:MAG: hypothetical protein ABIT91_24335 [Gemmatimonadaceae bacterium]